MKTITANTALPLDVLADLEYAAELAAAGRKDPEFAQRVRADVQQIREAILQRNGVLDIGVPAIRELRDAGGVNALGVGDYFGQARSTAFNSLRALAWMMAR
jgi:hypothetical protein